MKFGYSEIDLILGSNLSSAGLIQGFLGFDALGNADHPRRTDQP